MLNNINKVKNILSKLIIATQCFKKVLKIKKTKIALIILELLQKEGFIYGYNVCSYNNNFYFVYLKYSGNINCSLSKGLFLNKKIIFTNINNFEKNSLYLIFNKRGFSINKINKKNIGCYVIIRF